MFEKNPRVNSVYEELFNLLHKGFEEEKLFVPKSIFHDIEISMATHLKEAFFNRFYQMGQVQLQHYDTVAESQLNNAAQKFLSEKPQPDDHYIVFHDNPDKRVKMFDVHVDMCFENFFDIRSFRHRTTEQLKLVRKQVLDNKITFEEQREAEIETARQQILRDGRSATYLIRDQLQLEQFVHSSYFSEIPNLDISSQMWAAILTDKFGESPIREGHYNDIQIISTFLPYADIFTTDKYMVQLLQRLGLPEKYNTKIFSSSIKDVCDFKNYLETELPTVDPVNKPIVTIFVRADDKIKERSFEFFKELGLQTMSVEYRLGWVEIFAFDDGKMPSYFDKKIKRAIPFTGIQEIDHIPLPVSGQKDDVLAVCRNNCRSDCFLFIDHYRKLPENFLPTLIKYTTDGHNRILDYEIFSK